MATEKADVVIVGVGAAGAILAAELGKSGMKVVGLERGPRLKTEDFQLDELRYFQRQETRPNTRRQPVTWRPNANTRAVPIPSQNYGNQVGGGTVHYGGLSWRMHEGDFRPRTQSVERYGASSIPEDSSLIDWPLSYADLEPHYDRAEYELGVSGKAGNLKGRKIDGGNVFEAPRDREYPLPPLTVDQSGLTFAEGASKLGYHPFSSPRAILSQPYQGRPACSYCSFCQSFGCFIGAKSTVLLNKVPEAEATGNFKLITNVMCHRVNTDNTGKATGVAYYGPDGSNNTIEADLVILTPFIYESTKLLLLSKSEKFPNGLANSSGHVGKHIMTHLNARGFGIFDDRHINIFMGPSAQRHSIDDFNADNFDHGGLGFIRGAQISVVPADLEAGPIAVAMSMNPPPGVPRWGAAYRDFIAQYSNRYAGLVAQTENLPYADQTIDLDPDTRDAWGLPAPRMTYDWRRPNELKRIDFMRAKLNEIGRAMGASKTWLAPMNSGGPMGHHEGGTRMGSDPKNSVVNRYGQTWDVPNLFVIGSSTFPSMGCGFNPTLTIQALAYMSADAIVNRYKKNPGALL
ncbi:GMC family oxidoreductase [Rhodoplanes sp. Z2-YC6860]|uniref:GMC family oxidoreductase n=1 Tax=Rhodoplanes sp. Z2-YC6860 TaxID=674703 RepID=UPI00078BBA91|nr:GMC family oxidoreductase [Rhodoplanes sp. Z2-YC6860]AMN39111.1 membrane-bound D-gluconate 2-dehydrogenase large subunit [Rhodoplanes sp. Z2-YC6860]